MGDEELRSWSGSVEDPRRLVAFLYGLLRDHLPEGEGEVEQLVREAESSPGSWEFTNGYLANYGKLLADRLQDDQPGGR